MEELTLIHHNGSWSSDHEFTGYKDYGMLIPKQSTFDQFKRIIFETLNLDERFDDLRIQFLLKENYPPMTIGDDMTLQFYRGLKSKSDDIFKYALCTQIVHNEVDLEGTVVEHQASGSYDMRNDVLGNQISHHDEDMHEASDDQLRFIKFITDNTMKEIIATKHSVLEEGGSSGKQTFGSVIDHIFEGQVFKDKETLQTAMENYALKNKFRVRTPRSCSKKYYLSCLDRSCPWIFKSSRKANGNSFVVREYVGKHTCDFNTRCGETQVSKNFMAAMVKNSYLRLERIYTPGDIAEDLKGTLGVDLSYQRAWHIKEEALNQVRGTPSKSFRELPRALYMIEKTNPGSMVKIQRSGDEFLYLFLAFGGSIQGWNHCRPFIVIDATFLRSCYGGTLMCACAQDAAGSLFPLAFVVVDSENDRSWTWFLTQLKETYGAREDMLFISDRHNSILKACETVYPEIPHCFCVFHILQNMKRKFKSNIPDMSKYFMLAAKSYTMKDFDENMSQLRNISEKIPQYLEEIGFDKWSRVHSFHNRFNAMTSNAAESLNSVIKTAKDLPITALVLYLRGMMQDLFYEHRKIAEYTLTPLMDTREQELRETADIASKMKVEPAIDHLVVVSHHGTEHTVNLEKKTCTCNKFQLDGLPCAHVIAYIRHYHLNVYDFCSKYYKRDSMIGTYEGIIYPLPPKDDWSVLVENGDQYLRPPNVKRKSGRPTLHRKRPFSERRRKTTRCSFCGGSGHNRRKCRRLN